jgi:uncharacterized membrane protein
MSCTKNNRVHLQKSHYQILRIIILCTFILCIIQLPFSHAAKISGAIYDTSLTPIEKVVISINTTPEQKMVSKYGGYHFFVEPGEYELTATLTINRESIIIAKDVVVVTESNAQADIIRDLLMSENIILPVEKKTLTGTILDFFKSPFPYIAIIILILGLLFLHQKNRDKTKKQSTEIMQTQSLSADDKLKQKILEIIEHKKQTTQKYIRQQFTLSEAKISLILKELEDAQKITRIKEGRVNIITLFQEINVKSNDTNKIQNQAQEVKEELPKEELSDNAVSHK